MKNSKGISLVESLVACFLLFFVITLVLPQIYFTIIERKNLALENMARKVLHEKLFEQSFQNNVVLSETVLYKRVPLEINIELNTSSNLFKGCVSWTDFLNRDQKSCGTVRKW